jgi:hypothetical protein
MDTQMDNKEKRGKRGTKEEATFQEVSPPKFCIQLNWNDTRLNVVMCRNQQAVT